MFLGKKGVEGLPLKYLVIALVGSIVIATALQLTSSLQSSILESGDILSNQVTGKVTESALGDTYTTGFESFGIYGWNFDLGNEYPDEELELFLRNDLSSAVNVTRVVASFGGEDNVESDDLLLSSGSSVKLSFDFVSNTVNDLEEGDPIEISLRIETENNGVDTGRLVGMVLDSSN